MPGIHPGLFIVQSSSPASFSDVVTRSDSAEWAAAAAAEGAAVAAAAAAADTASLWAIWSRSEKSSPEEKKEEKIKLRCQLKYQLRCQ